MREQEAKLQVRLPKYNTNFPDYERVSPIALTNRLGPLLVVAGAFNRGAGETQLELNRRTIRDGSVTKHELKTQ